MPRKGTVVAQDARPLFDVQITKDVVYGEAGIHFTGKRTVRPLLLDVYEPAAAEGAQRLRPAIVLAFGGAYHRGSKEDDAFSVGEGTSTSAAWYARYWAERGYVAFCIDYRLIPEDPDPGITPVLFGSDAVGFQRMRAIRENMGLPALDDTVLGYGVEAGADDMAAAARYVYDNATRWRVDPDRVALWGWSAGARNALHAVFSEGVQAAAVIALSAYVHEDTLKRMRCPSGERPALFLAYAERDMPHIQQQAMPMAAFFQALLPVTEQVKVLDIDHFYPSHSPVESPDGASMSLLEAMDNFLDRQLSSPA